MKKAKKWLVVFGVIIFSLVLFLSCDNGGAGEKPTQEDINNFGAGLTAAFSPITVGETGLVSTDGNVIIVISGTETDPVISITWNNFTDSTSGITISGTLNISGSFDADSSTLSLTIAGTMSFTGAPVTNVEIDITMAIDASDEATISGSIIIDGTDFDASGFGFDDEDFLF
jgi:hypothetical protein